MDVETVRTLASCHRDIREQIKEAYRRMAKTAHYYPEAPSDGCGNLTGEIDVEAEAERYWRHWWLHEDDHTFWIGCCNYSTRPATIFAIEGARLMCGGELFNRPALALLKMAVADLEEDIEKRHRMRKSS